jgi:hypothetical protein
VGVPSIIDQIPGMKAGESATGTGHLLAPTAGENNQPGLLFLHRQRRRKSDAAGEAPKHLQLSPTRRRHAEKTTYIAINIANNISDEG